jgi:hypothetical protein
MAATRSRLRQKLLLPLALFGAIALVATRSYAISVLQIDNFQDGTTQNWRGAATGAVADAGPAGAGDFALCRAARTPGWSHSAAATTCK